ncbi:hypothetical protein BC829DRAFT_423715 [Chytridium lagenaria]|nr:hypothetical protein BC829DRAFT_423715 [Chytridium lagenaria]
MARTVTMISMNCTKQAIVLPLHPSDRRLRVTEQGASNTGIATGIETTGNPVPVVDIQTPLSQQAAPIHGTFKIKSGQISDDGWWLLSGVGFTESNVSLPTATIRQANPRRNAYFDNVASAQASALRNSFFRRHWEHLAQTGYLSAGFEKNVPGFTRGEIKRLNDNYIDVDIKLHTITETGWEQPYGNQ